MLSISSYPDDLIVTHQMFVEFRDKIRCTFYKMTREQLESPAYLFDYDKKALRFSFDREGDCFIGNTLGLTPEQDRVYLDEMPELLIVVSERMKECKISHRLGGRLFIDYTHCYFKDVQKQKIILFKLKWPIKMNIYDELKYIRQQLISSK